MSQSGAGGLEPLLRGGAAALATALLLLYPAPGQTARAPAPEQAVQALAQGSPQGFIVLFDDSAVKTEAKNLRAIGGHGNDTPAILGLKAKRYHTAKQLALESLPTNQWRTLRNFSHLPMAYIEVSTPLALERLRNRSGVIALLPNQRWDLALAESGPLISQPQTVALGQGGAGTTVAVLDTGVDYTHTAFGSCTAPGTPTGCRVTVAIDFATDDGELDDDGHGTNVAGIVAGIAPESKIAALDVFDGSSASSTDIIDAINWTIANRDTYNIVAINLSLSGHTEYSTPCDSNLSNPFRSPISNARDAGILTIAAAGNDGFSNGLPMPACTPEAVSVGAVYDEDLASKSYGNCTDNPAQANQVTCFSNSASYLSVLAPGAIITAAGYSYSGTSQAAPHVSALVALLKGAHADESADQIESRMLSSSTSVTDSKNGLSYPRIEALESVTEGTADLGISLAASPDPVYVDQTLVYTLTVSNDGPATASNPVVTDQLPAAVSFVSASTECAEAAGTVTCNLADLSSGANTEIQISVTTDTDGAITNTPTVGSDTQDLISSNDSSALTTTVNPAADLSLSLTDSPDPVLQGATLTYSASIDNLGPSTATGITLSYTLPADASFVSASPECIETAGTVSCTLDDMATGTSTNIQIKVTANNSGNLDATVDVAGTEFDPASTNNSQQTSTQVNSAGNGTAVKIPLPPWALILLGILLPILGWLAGIRNRTAR
jgi:uncharacterized repeat protein (TIGR01451 family)